MVVRLSEMTDIFIGQPRVVVSSSKDNNNQLIDIHFFVYFYFFIIIYLGIGLLIQLLAVNNFAPLPTGP